MSDETLMWLILAVTMVMMAIGAMWYFEEDDK